MKQVKEGLHESKRAKKTKSSKSTRQRALVPKKDEAKVNLPDEDQHLEVHSTPVTQGEGSEAESELEAQLQVKEALYLSNLGHECYDLRRQVEDVLNNHLRSA